MALYILKRILLMIPTLIGILFINFLIIQFVPGGPVESLMLRLQGSEEFFGALSGESGALGEDDFAGRDKATEDFIARFREKFALDEPFFVRFAIMLGNYARFDFGDSYFKADNVTKLIFDRVPVSIALGLWSTILIYLISIPLGVAKAVRDGSRFDFYTSTIIIIAYALPSIILPVMLMMYFAGGADWGIFPLRGLVSDNFDELSPLAKIGDYFWHVALPVIAMTISGFATKTLLTKNSFLDEINKLYVLTARAKGLSENGILYGHVFRNAMLIIIAGFPAIFIHVFFSGSLIVETTFSLNGLGRLGFEAVLAHDYPIVFGTLFIFSLIGLIIHLLSDLTYVLVDPRIDFEARG